MKQTLKQDRITGQMYSSTKMKQIKLFRIYLKKTITISFKNIYIS
jgi:hypothetical protein